MRKQHFGIVEFLHSINIWFSSLNNLLKHFFQLIDILLRRLSSLIFRFPFQSPWFISSLHHLHDLHLILRYSSETELLFLCFLLNLMNLAILNILLVFWLLLIFWFLCFSEFESDILFTLIFDYHKLWNLFFVENSWTVLLLCWFCFLFEW